MLEKIVECLLVAIFQAAGKAAWNWLRERFNEKPRF